MTRAKQIKKPYVRNIHSVRVRLKAKMVGVTGLKPATSRSQTARAINCATPRYVLYHTGDHSLPEQNMVGVTGLEPATSPSRTVRATKLRHTPRYKTLPSYHTIWRLVYCLAAKTEALTNKYTAILGLHPRNKPLSEYHYRIAWYFMTWCDPLYALGGTISALSTSHAVGYAVPDSNV